MTQSGLLKNAGTSKSLGLAYGMAGIVSVLRHNCYKKRVIWRRAYLAYRRRRICSLSMGWLQFSWDAISLNKGRWKKPLLRFKME